MYALILILVIVLALNVWMRAKLKREEAQFKVDLAAMKVMKWPTVDASLKALDKFSAQVPPVL